MHPRYALLLCASTACDAAPRAAIALDTATAPTTSEQRTLAPAVAQDPSPVAASLPALEPAGDATPDLAERIELTFTGDVMFGGTFGGSWMPSKVPARDPLEKVAHLLKSDLALANLETTVMTTIPKLQGSLRFVATPDQVATLPRHGLMAVTLANNHANDAGAAGVDETPAHLADLGMTVIGAARADASVYPVDTIDVRGWKVGFVAATTKLNRAQQKQEEGETVGPRAIPLLAPEDLKDSLLPVITEAKEDHDVVIVVLHWGVQYEDTPAPWQVAAARAFIDAGASAVVGHHPHVLQGIERYGEGVIAYSLGNFVFQNSSSPSRETGVLRLGFSRTERCLDQLVFHPAIVRVGDIYYPDVPSARELVEVGKRVIGLSGSKKLKTSWRLAGDAFVADAPCAAIPAAEAALGQQTLNPKPRDQQSRAPIAAGAHVQSGPTRRSRSTRGRERNAE